jgi:phosphocarrier protein
VIRRKIVLPNKHGLHMRAANVFADSASRFASKVQVGRGDLMVNGKSIMGLMMLAAPGGTEIVVVADGADEEIAVHSLVELIRTGFGEELRTDRETRT